MSHTQITIAPGVTVSSSDVRVLQQAILNFDKENAHLKEKLQLMKRNAEDWQSRACRPLLDAGWVPGEGTPQKALFKSFDENAATLAKNHVEQQREMESLRKQLAAEKDARVKTEKTLSSKVKTLETQLADEKKAEAELEARRQTTLKGLRTQLAQEKQTHAKAEAARQAELKALREELASEKRAHETTRNTTKNSQALQSKDSEMLKARAANAQKEFNTRLAAIKAEHDAKFKTAQSHWDKERSFLKNKLADAQHQVLEAKNSVDSLVTDNYNLESNLGTLEEEDVVAQYLVAELQENLQAEHQARVQAEEEIQHYQQLLEEALAAGRHARDQPHAFERKTEASTDNDPVDEEHGPTGAIWERVIKDGFGFLGDSCGYFHRKPYRLIWVLVIWWAVMMMA